MTNPWIEFHLELERWQRSGLEVDFWWRDDDAGPPSAALQRLLRLSEAAEVPLTLAVIPEVAEVSALRGTQADFSVIQHGVDHRNRSASHEKKSEFPEHEPQEQALKRLVEGRARLGEIARERLLAVLAPPWNRISHALVTQLGTAGFRGLSRFGVRNITNPSVPGLIEANTHVDIVDWHGTRGFCGVERALAQATRHLAARRTSQADSLEPTGWLTHHAVHDEASWAFLEQLFDVTRSLEGVRWRSAGTVFAARAGPG